MEEDESSSRGNDQLSAPPQPPPPSASWNPALRPEKHGHASKPSISSVDDFFDRYPGPTPEKRRPQPMSEVVDRGEDQVIPPPVFGEEETVGDGIKESEEEQPIFDGADETVAEQTQALEERTSDAVEPEITSARAEHPSDIVTQTVDRPAADSSTDYEHQGELTELERAIDEAPSAPLLMDPEAPPVVDDVVSKNIVELPPQTTALDTIDSGFQSPPSEEPPPHHSIDRSFTTNFTDLPNSELPSSEQEQGHAGMQPIDPEWPAVADDKVFAELLDGDTTADSVPDAFAGQEHETAEAKHEMAVEDHDTQLAPAVPEKEEDLAAAWQAALDDDDLLDPANDLDPSSFFGDDDDGFLEDELGPLPTDAGPAGHSTSASSNAGQYTPQTTGAAPYSNPAFLSQTHGRSVSTPHTGLNDLYSPAVVAEQPPQRPGLSSAQSFVDKAKGGYQSPYDLPMDVIKQPRQRPRQAPPAPIASTPPGRPVPPPRTSSFSSHSQFADSRPPTAAGSAPGPNPAQNPSATQKPSPSVAATRTASSDSGFFADLPVASRAKPRQSGAYTPQAQNSPALPPTQLPPHGRPGPPSAVPSLSAVPSVHPAPNQSGPAPVYAGLRQPEKLPLLPDQPSIPQSTPSQPGAPPQTHRYSPSRSTSQPRYSPAPAAQAPAAASRYSPVSNAKPVQPIRQPSVTAIAAAGIQGAHPFAPRTSSPLAFPTEPQQLPYTPDGQRKPSFQASSPPKTNGFRSNVLSPPSGPLPPQRPQTQSPPTVMKAAKTASMALDRSLSAAPTHIPAKPTMLHRRHLSRDLTFSPPADERAHDPLERWKGQPIFVWGNSGAIVNSFPQHNPFYAAGHAIPSVRCTPGPITLQDAKSWSPLDERMAKFPGPLTARAKGKKKDVLSWMTAKIEDLQTQRDQSRLDFEIDNELKHRIEEKLVLWRIMKIFVDHNGTLEGDAKFDEEIRAILLPNLAPIEPQSPTSAGAGALHGAVQGDQIDRAAVLELRQALLEGQRERAVFLAEDKKLWGHAMIIASTMGPDVWKRTVQSFVRSQVKPVGSDTRSLAALYQIFAGNAEECADELVPPSARHGRQFVSISGPAAGDPLAGLDQWRETLGLVAGNRTPNDAQSIVSLGKLLGDYGRPEAAHTCFLFARNTAKHTGADDAEANFVLLGSNHRGPDASFGQDLDSIVLTEIYEWAVSLSAPSTAMQYIPHLQSYKLIHAQQLAAYGLKNQAQAYCDHITTAYTSTTRPSPYYHPAFTQAVADLSAFLSQTPHNGPQGLLSKTAMNKVSSGAASWFTKFVSGDDDTQSNSSAAGAGSDDQLGPFGRVEGDSPQLSRTGSVADLYNPMAGSPPVLSHMSQVFPAQQSPSLSGRYAPAGPNRYNPGAITSQPAEFRRPMTASSRSYAPTSGLSAGLARSDGERAVSDSAMGYSLDARPGTSSNVSSPFGSYDARPAMSETASAYGYQPPAPETTGPAFSDSESYSHGLNIVNAGGEEHVADAEGGGYAPPVNGYEPPSSGYEPPSSGYEPPSSGYEPPSYQPYEPDPEDAPTNETASKPKKKSMMDDDDDDDLAGRAAAMQKAQKAAADRQADDAFRKAAEADAARDAAGKGGDKRNSGWFGGWFKKDGSAGGPAPPGPIRAKLGEENSFVYDETLKKWVNKKGGAEAAAPVAATPPPPRGPPVRAPASGPPSGPPSRVASGAAMAGPPGGGPRPAAVGAMASGPPSPAGTPGLPPAAAAAVNGAVLAPPSRPSTGMSNASSLDDLLGGPPGPGVRKAAGGAKGKKKGGRYVDVMGAK